MSDAGDDRAGQPGDEMAPGAIPAARAAHLPGLDGAGGAPDPLQDAYRVKLESIDALPEVPMRAAAIGDALKSLEPREAAWWLDQLIRGAVRGKAPEFDAMLACALWLTERRIDDDYNLFQSLFEAAHDDVRPTVTFLLRDPPPHQQLPKNRKLRAPKLPIDRDVSLGERRQMARGRRRDLLNQLLLDPDPGVVRQLLSNPNIREQDVLQIASRRPSLPEILLEVALRPKWFKRLRVREAIVLNPYATTGLSLRLLPTLGLQKLRGIRNSTHLHPLLIESAELLVTLREEHTAPWRV